MGRLAILAGQGALPEKIAAAHPGALFAYFVDLDGDLPPNDTLRISYERFGEIFDGLNAANVTEVVFAGSLARPTFNPANFDAKMTEIAPILMGAMKGGDDGLLRAVITTFEAEGFKVRGAHELVDGLTAQAGLLTEHKPDYIDIADMKRARAILAALAPLDVGQAAVVADGQALGVETAQGTDAMLGFVAQTPVKLRQRAKGVLVKRPKRGQDLRVDMPAIGPATVQAAIAAGLAGIAIAEGTVLILDREEMLDIADKAGLFILAEPN